MQSLLLSDRAVSPFAQALATHPRRIFGSILVPVLPPPRAVI